MGFFSKFFGGDQKQEWRKLVRLSYRKGVSGEYWESIRHAEDALELNPEASEAYRLMGNAYEFLGDEKEEHGDFDQAREFHNKATEAWDRARDINPGITIPGYHGRRIVYFQPPGHQGRYFDPPSPE